MNQVDGSVLNATINLLIEEAELQHMGMTRKYWKGLEELKETPEFLKSREQEFPAEM